VTARRWGFVALEVVLLAAVPLLAWIGFGAVLDTTAGTAVDPELDPAEPGYEAFVDPTPVALLLGTDADGALSWLTVAALGGPSGQGGSLLAVPPTTVADAGDLGPVTLAEAWAQLGQPGLVQAVGDVLDAGFADVVVLDPARLAAVLAPASPLTLTLADDVAGFDTGEVELGADDVVALLGARGRRESDLGRLARHEGVWRAWLDRVAASDDPDVVPGERTSGVGRYVRGLAAGSTSFDVIPVSAVPADDDEASETFAADADAVGALVNDRIPFPVAARPGGRPRVRVLDGVGADGLAVAVARDVVRAGGQVVVLGNADRFEARDSRVVYFDAGLAGPAAGIADGLGIDDVGRLEGPNPNDLVDVTVVVGTDLAEAYGLSPRAAGGEDAG